MKITFKSKVFENNVWPLSARWKDVTLKIWNNVNFIPRCGDDMWFDYKGLSRKWKVVNVVWEKENCITVYLELN